MTKGQKMTKRKISMVAGGLIAIGGLAGFGAVGSVGGGPEQAQLSRPVPVEVLTLEAADSIPIRRTYTGLLKAARSSELGFELAGKLEQVLVDEGDHVVANQILAELDTDSLLARKEQLEAERDQAMAMLAELEAGPRREQIAAAKAEVENLRAQWQLARASSERSEQLRRRDVVSQEEYDQHAFGSRAALARLDAAQRRLDELEAGTRTEQIAAQRAVVARLNASLKQINLDIEDSQLRAPFDGVVAARYVDEGTVAAQGTPVLRLLDRTSLEAWIGLPPDEIAGIELGEPHELQIDDRQYEATVTGILPELDSRTRTRSVVLRLVDPHEELVAGLVARMSHSVEQRDAGFWLPVEALTRGDRGLWSVLAVNIGKEAGSPVVERRDVELLHSDGDRVYVRGTLSAYETVVARGTHRLVHGQRVEVTNANSPNVSASQSLTVGG
jgi:multidrug efflux pump subunit AcrA (membrane-fusion protein)